MTERRRQALVRIGVLGDVRKYLLHSVNESLEALRTLTPRYIEALSDVDAEACADQLERMRREEEIIRGYVQMVLEERWSWQ